MARKKSKNTSTLPVLVILAVIAIAFFSSGSVIPGNHSTTTLVCLALIPCHTSTTTSTIGTCPPQICNPCPPNCQTSVTTTTTTNNYYGMDSCSIDGCQLYVSCTSSFTSLDPIVTGSYSNGLDSCFVGGANYFGYSSGIAAFAKAQGYLESGLKAVIYSSHDSFPGPCGYSGWDPMTNYYTQDASHSFGVMQETPACSDGTFASYSVSQGQGFGYGNCIGTGSDMQSIPSAQYFYCQPEGQSGDPSILIGQFYTDVVTNPNQALYSKSAYNPAYNIWTYWNDIHGMYASTLTNAPSNDGNLWACTANQQWYIVIAAYNQGSVYGQLYNPNGQSANCVLNSGANNGGWNGYDYVNGILNNYQQMYGSRGQFSQFPYY